MMYLKNLQSDQIKRNSFILILVLVVSFFVGCKPSPKDAQQEVIKKMTSQTLGLAYLEEFKLDEAESEFIKYIKMAPDDKVGYANLGLAYLRMGKYPEAEKQLLKAINLDANDADTKLLLSTVYQMNGESKKAISVLTEALEKTPGHVRILYNLSELYSVESDQESKNQRKNCIFQLVEKAPGNFVPQLSLIEIYIQNKETDKAIQQLEIIQKQFPEFPKEAIDYYKNTLDFLRQEDIEKAGIQFTIFQNYMKVTSPYQAGIMDLKGPGGNLIGFPLITYDQQSSSQVVEDKSLLDVIKFTEVSESAQLDVALKFNAETDESENYTHVTSADYDGDGDLDIYVGSYDIKTTSYNHFLFNNEMGRFTDVAKEVGIDHSGKELSALFVDYDNDGFLDLYIVREQGDLLYLNAGKGSFKDVTKDAGIGSKTGGNKALFFDLDHDGDLDLFEATANTNLVFRNNADGTFTEMSEKMGLAGKIENTSDAAFGDFDDDGDIDLIAVNESGIVLYSNQRQSEFKEVSIASGLSKIKGANSVEVADYNNDGFLDLFFTSANGGTVGFFQNKGDGVFNEFPKNKNLFANLLNAKTYDARIFDFDNDGYLDILVAGETEKENGNGLFLFHNEGVDNFSDVSHLLPQEYNSGRQIALFDYNDDGDIDVVLAGINGGVCLLRNDGGSINHYLNMKLVGLRAGSAKNNYFGIGAKVEMRSGDLYQSMVVTEPGVHFGMGHRTQADVIRITWTNGVPQNIFKPGADQALIEAQTLKGSCPFLYTWNGEEYVFVKDITWRSALGMPLGIMGGNTQYAFANASDDFIKISGELLKPKNGKYSIQVTSELWETIYMDQIQLAVVDHPDSIDVFVPEQFTPPPFPGFNIFQVKDKIVPVAAENEDGKDVLSLISEDDHKYVSGFNPEKYQGITDMHSLILDPGNVDQKNLVLFMNGWIFPTDASINFALSQSESLNVAFPVIQVINKKGEWETVVDNVSFPMGKDKTVITDLSGKFLSKDRKVRILTNMEIYWDHIFFSNVLSDAPVESTILNPETADIHYRGFSRTFKKGGRYGPHWFDYYDVDENKKWRDLTGNYTRYGDVKPLLEASDNKYIISNAGDETSITFDAQSLPKLKKGWKRDFMIRSVGWVKDGDMNTAYGNTVLPLPFHGMESYPPSKKDVYPETPELKKYNKKYNTRVIKMDDFRKAFTNKN